MLATRSELLFGGLCGLVIAYVVYLVTNSKVIGGILGVIVALVICITPYLPQQTCMNCGAHMKFGEDYCSVCGNYQKSADIFGKLTCEHCRRKVDVNAKVCPYCGSLIDRFHDVND